MLKSFGFFTTFLTANFVAVLCLITMGCDLDEEQSNDSKGIRPIHTVAYDGVGVDLDANENLLSLASENAGITVYDTTNPARPLTVGNVKLPLVYKTLLHDQSVFGFDSNKGLVAVDLLDHDRLSLTQSLSSAELFGYVNDAIWIDSTFIFASEAVGLSTYTLGDEFSLKGGKADYSNPESQGTTNIAIMPGRLITASYSGDISSYLRQEGKPPTLLGWTVTPHKISGLACGPELCYATGLADGIWVYRLDEQGKPQVVRNIQLDRTVENIYIDGDLLFVSHLGARGQGGWYTFDISSPESPRKTHTLSSGSQVKDFACVGPMVYVLLEDGKIQIFKREALL